MVDFKETRKFLTKKLGKIHDFRTEQDKKEDRQEQMRRKAMKKQIVS
jgi:hypothetical protein